MTGVQTCALPISRLETGYEIGVPLFITTGEKVKVDTRTGDYLGRVNS